MNGRDRAPHSALALFAVQYLCGFGVVAVWRAHAREALGAVGDLLGSGVERHHHHPRRHCVAFVLLASSVVLGALSTYGPVAGYDMEAVEEGVTWQQVSSGVPRALTYTFGVLIYAALHAAGGLGADAGHSAVS
jgi:hypothetical protein